MLSAIFHKIQARPSPPVRPLTGFGMTTPATVGGKAFLIAYGLFGCAGTILFFNLFLERIISLLAFVMRACRERLRPEADGLAGWKPSVYHVLLILGLFAVLLSCCASAMYASVEGWGYVDSLYFCFVTFSTIGFGDLVSSQRAAYRNQGLYRLGNFLFILLGVCCIYSLFNVVSILIKQVLNWMLRKLSCACCARCCPAPGAPLARRNAITLQQENEPESQALSSYLRDTDSAVLMETQQVPGHLSFMAPAALMVLPVSMAQETAPSASTFRQRNGKGKIGYIPSFQGNDSRILHVTCSPFPVAVLCQMACYSNTGT
ncbi:potassium channel subfamily K member 12 [Fukomys damarensis]|uniref:potassium channel subfamily K member 12 n=1 Tax=Fukomys damarensis TaxID=885580 RepID=UPI00145557E8|nr:potassium channel subfamily K member 12 [Fukomys damarensis]